MFLYEGIAQHNGQWTSFLAPHSFSDVGRKFRWGGFFVIGRIDKRCNSDG